MHRTERATGGDQPIRVVLVDDQELFVEGLAALLGDALVGPGLEVVETILDPSRAVERIVELGPDVVVLDYRMGPPDGIEVTAAVRAALPLTRVVLLTGLPDDEVFREALAAGASGCLPKDIPATQLAMALRLLAGGFGVVPEDLLRTARPRSGTSATRPDLADADRELLTLVARGLTYDELAEELHVSPRTARRMVDSLLSTLGVGTRIEAAAIAGRVGLAGT